MICQQPKTMSNTPAALLTLSIIKGVILCLMMETPKVKINHQAADSKNTPNIIILLDS